MTIAITFTEPDGNERTIAADPGSTVMRAALDAGVEGIVADCGGDCSCATCHVYVGEAFLDRFAPPSNLENEMLEGTASERRNNSRLSCQLALSEGLDGLCIIVPERQF